ncbi:MULTISPECIES: hypothetical protein [unclassified Bradyrhizobium]|uniref:hypothetical protein n=1 Tax=unclassified Bradyrhizobium TaxID=2631580 RepID=UPI002478E76B|nr:MULTISPECIES: hypothetical protein [unclassified Bradyrhizobium]WGR94948.1 hypothetical protein MTX20_12840 [Bradyrhizobium sp. ISRA435]WGR99807.1 hypothetical protein MTX23_02765 [Bradyrhizobium sp. ISRA436]WGS06697.1 hypothetical protein MTX18_02765 [Bradyrhizobium sp. ISRA437]WGS13581.1 hypothetical protein MTX26_02765 [Bradyrhizobium sp. ISRA443]WGS20556.1 hypothetical protein MTX22_01585 [Bradyrhizobium sp. ISRA463]
MTADSNSHIAWQRAQLRKHRAALKALEVDQLKDPTCGTSRRMQKTIAELERKIWESGRCIAEYERRTRRPLATDRGSLASVSWTHWSTSPVNARPHRHRA